MKNDDTPIWPGPMTPLRTGPYVQTIISAEHASIAVTRDDRCYMTGFGPPIDWRRYPNKAEPYQPEGGTRH